jgi:hypothetical protein
MYILPLNHKDHDRTKKSRGTDDKEDREEKGGAGMMSNQAKTQENNTPQLNHTGIVRQRKINP